MGGIAQCTISRHDDGLVVVYCGGKQVAEGYFSDDDRNRLCAALGNCTSHYEAYAVMQWIMYPDDYERPPAASKAGV